MRVIAHLNPTQKSYPRGVAQSLLTIIIKDSMRVDQCIAKIEIDHDKFRKMCIQNTFDDRCQLHMHQLFE